jgi:predicted lipoprotein with Yx(FWY)xxD motif
MRLRRPLTALVLAVAVSAIGVGLSLAKTTTTTLKAEKISALKITALANARGRTLYHLKPETSKPKHLLCTSKTCLSAWFPATVKSKTTKVKLPKGITGKVTLLHRGKAYQICVGGFPLYTFVGDNAKGKAVGQHIKSFGGIWGVLKTKSAAKKPVVAPPPPPAY